MAFVGGCHIAWCSRQCKEFGTVFMEYEAMKIKEEWNMSLIWRPYESLSMQSDTVLWCRWL